MDELLTDVMCNYYFHRPKNNTYGSLWRTKRFRVFVHHITDEMFLGKKLSVVDAIKSVPIDVSKAIRRVNDVRNDIAHTFFPENRRRYIAELLLGILWATLPLIFFADASMPAQRHAIITCPPGVLGGGAFALASTKRHKPMGPKCGLFGSRC